MISNKKNQDWNIFIEKLKTQSKLNSGISTDPIVGHIRNAKLLIRSLDNALNDIDTSNESLREFSSSELSPNLERVADKVSLNVD